MELLFAVSHRTPTIPSRTVGTDRHISILLDQQHQQALAMTISKTTAGPGHVASQRTPLINEGPGRDGFETQDFFAGLGSKM